LPALGWNSWNAFECDIDDLKIMIAANQIVNLGLRDGGYEYVNSMWNELIQRVEMYLISLVDDCWSIKNSRNTSNNRIIPDPSKFPDGIAGVEDKVHALGLKIGIYSSECFALQVYTVRAKHT
jgi:alpha-galactosidase